MSNVEYRAAVIVNLKEFAGGKGFMNMKEIAEFMGVSRDTARIMMHDVQCLTAGRDKRYLIDEIAERIVKMRKAA